MNPGRDDEDTDLVLLDFLHENFVRGTRYFDLLRSFNLFPQTRHFFLQQQTTV